MDAAQLLSDIDAFRARLSASGLRPLTEEEAIEHAVRCAVGREGVPGLAD